MVDPLCVKLMIDESAVRRSVEELVFLALPGSP